MLYGLPRVAPAGARMKLGDPARLPDGREGWILRTLDAKDGPSVEVWFADGTWAGPMAEHELDA